MVENASSQKAKSENFITKFARYYTPIVVIIAVILAVTLPFIFPEYDLTWEGGFKESIMTALVFLVVSCPCALLLSIPLGFFGGIGGASRQGILIKGSNYLESLNSVKTFVFDKTGTLTEGNFIVDDIITFGEYSKEEILEYAAHAEMNSKHLIAESIVKAYGESRITASRIKAEKQSSNTGVRSTVDKKDISVGKKEFLEDLGLVVRDVDAIGARIYVSIDSNVEGVLIIKDKVKENARNVINDLKALGVKKTIMLTGDSESVAKSVASEVLIDEYYSNLSPIDKVNMISHIKSASVNDGLVFIGDGINDAPALSRADVGIAMGTLGSDAAIQVADIVLMTDDLGKLPIMLKIAKKTRLVVIENIILALTVKLVAMALAVLKPLFINTGIAPIFDYLIYFALFSDVGVSLIAVVNSMRAMRVKK
jgi:Cd2+/Zn2+-exporting ATPase